MRTAKKKKKKKKKKGKINSPWGERARVLRDRSCAGKGNSRPSGASRRKESRTPGGVNPKARIQKGGGEYNI